MPDVFDDLDRLRLPEGWVPPPRPRKVPPPRHKPGARFLKGPVPWAWLRTAIRLHRRGRALDLGLLLWLEAGLTRSRVVRVNLSRLGDLGISLESASRALRNLELAGLVSVARRPGRQSEITLLDAEALR
jgi:hypothetical protein